VCSIHVSKNRTNQICRVVASKSHLNQATQTFIDRLGEVSFIQAGSSLKFCRVAEGIADIYPRLAPTCEWDTAAAHAILEGAGGEVLDLKGQPLLYGKSDVLNPSFIATRDRILIPKIDASLY
jgi:3'(2'), 5'-bisphosphate nucleotidase